jgi:hypothetical protein
MNAPIRSMPDISMKSLTELERVMWLARAIGGLMNMAEDCGISRDSDWYQSNLRFLHDVARGDHDA